VGRQEQVNRVALKVCILLRSKTIHWEIAKQWKAVALDEQLRTRSFIR
jgi:hypothetical protein